MATPLSSNMRPKLTARIGAGKVAACRCGYLPKDVRATPVGFYFWEQKQGPVALDDAVTWTSVQT